MFIRVTLQFCKCCARLLWTNISVGDLGFRSGIRIQIFIWIQILIWNTDARFGSAIWIQNLDQESWGDVWIWIRDLDPDLGFRSRSRIWIQILDLDQDPWFGSGCRILIKIPDPYLNSGPQIRIPDPDLGSKSWIHFDTLIPLKSPVLPVTD
jgi:hypothetical protein